VEAAQLRDAARLPLWRKIEWLEDMHRLALRARRRDKVQVEEPGRPDSPEEASE